MPLRVVHVVFIRWKKKKKTKRINNETITWTAKATAACSNFTIAALSSFFFRTFALQRFSLTADRKAIVIIKILLVCVWMLRHCCWYFSLYSSIHQRNYINWMQKYQSRKPIVRLDFVYFIYMPIWMRGCHRFAVGLHYYYCCYKLRLSQTASSETKIE